MLTAAVPTVPTVLAVLAVLAACPTAWNDRSCDHQDGRRTDDGAAAPA